MIPKSYDNLQYSNMSPGKLYELAIFTHTLINNPNKKFDLGTEIRFADKFDDLVIRVNDNQYTFAQIKLVDNIEVNVIDSKVLLGEKRISLKKDDFKLQKYFVSYMRIKDQLNARNQTNTIQKLIIFTNAHLELKEINKDIANLKKIKHTNDDILIQNENADCYKMSDVSSTCIQTIKKDLKCDLQILIEEIAKYLSYNSNQDTMTLDNDCFRYYHTALIDEKVIDVHESQQGNKKVKVGKFTQNFIHEIDLSRRAKKLKTKLIDLITEKQKNIKVVQDNIAKAEWKLSDDFGLCESNDVIFLPEYEISDKDVKDFFSILELRVNQLGVKDILLKIKSEEIKNRFLEYFDTDPKLVEFIITDFVQNWRESDSVQDRWLLHSKRSDFIKQMQIKIAKPQAIHRTQKYIQYLDNLIKKYKLSFKDTYIEKYFLTKKCVFIRTTSNILSSIKIVEYLKRINHVNYIFIDLENLSIQREIIKLMDAFRDAKYTLFILSYKSLEDDIVNELFSVISSIIQGNNKQVVIITSKADLFIIKFSNYKEYIDKINGIEDFVDNSKILALEITIQGQTKQVKDLYKHINPQIIDRLITNCSIDIGLNISEMNYIAGAHSEFFDDINMDSFVNALSLQKCSDIYIISGIPGTWKVDRFIKAMGITDTSIGNIIKDQAKIIDRDKSRTLNKKIYVTGDEFKDREFKEISRYNADKKIYWINFNYHLDDTKFALVQIYNPKFYIKVKRFNNGVAISKRIQKQLMDVNLHEIFLISGKDKKEIENWFHLNKDEKKLFDLNYGGKIILVTESHLDPNLMFQELVEQNVGGTVHMLNLEQDELLWCKTHGSIDNLIKYRNENYRNTDYLLDEDELIQYIKDKKVVIFAGEPGIGKSTAIVKLYGLKYKISSGTEESLNLLHWVIRVKLKDHLKLIRDIDIYHNKEEDVENDIINFLSQIDSSFEDDITKTLLGLALMKEDFGKPLLLVFDGFDEILDKEDRDKVISLLKKIKYKTHAKCWITTRLHCENTLETELSEFAIRLEAMDIEHVRMFIITYFKDHLDLIFSLEDFNNIFNNNKGTVFSNVLHRYTEAFLNKMQEIFKGDISSFIGTPLQLFLMLQESAKYLKKWIGDCITEIPDFSYLGNNIFEVYENFIERKYDTYFTKRGVKEIAQQKLEKVVLNDFHKDLTKSLLLESEVKISFEEFKDIILSAGIVRSDGKKIEFIHPTFREYYAAKIFFDWITKCARNSQNKVINSQEVKYLFQDILSNPFHQVIRGFINVKLLKVNVQVYEKTLLFQEQYYNKHILYLAFRENNFGIARFLLHIHNFRDINLVSMLCDTESPLKYAVFYENKERLELLVKYCANIDSSDKIYTSVLHFAVELCQLEMVKFLVEHGADVNARNLEDETAIGLLFHEARSPWSVQLDLEIAQFLIHGGANINTFDKWGEAIICRAASIRGNIDKVNFLLYNGAEIDFKRENGNTALLCAIKQGDYEIFECLVVNGANINVLDDNGDTVLSNVLFLEKSFEMVKVLMAYGVNINIRNKNGSTALDVASQVISNSETFVKIATLLVENGLHIDTRIKKDIIILRKAARSGSLELLKLLLETRVNIDQLLKLCPSLLHIAAKSGNLCMVKFLVENDDLIYSKANEGRILDTAFSELDDFNIVNYLVQNNTNFNARDKDRYTALHYAAKYDNLEMVRYFVQKFANCNARDKDGFSVLHYAAKCNNIEMIEFLLENGADINATANNGMTVLHSALYGNNASVEVVQFLVERGVDVNALTNIDQSPMHLAILNQHNHIAEYLLENGANLPKTEDNEDIYYNFENIKKV